MPENRARLEDRGHDEGGALVRRLRAAAVADVAEAAAGAADRAAGRADREGLVDVALAPFDSPVGGLLLAATADGLVAVGFDDDAEEWMLDRLAARVSARVVRLPRRLDPVRRALERYFRAPRGHDLTGVAVDWRLTGDFQRAVLERARRIPLGATATYGTLARDVGHPGAARAVGTALGRNPIPIVVPCHRVVPAGGGLGGYGGGLPRKERLLALEGAILG